MKKRYMILGTALAAGFALISTASQAAPVFVSLNTVTPGSESVTLVPNGGFESGTTNTSPDNWTRVGSPFFDTPANAGAAANPGGLAAFSNLPTSGNVSYYLTETSTGPNKLGQWRQTIPALEANTEYVFSATVWNNSVAVYGSSRNFVLDFNDQPSPALEPQIVVSGGLADAEDGYFVYLSFNTTDTGTGPFTIRGFTQPTADYASDGDLIMIWDNIAVTKASEFSPPAIPEPGSLALLGLGGLCALRRRRQA